MLLYMSSHVAVYVSSYYYICVLFSCCGDEERSVRRRNNEGTFVPQAAVHFGRRYVVDSLRVMTPPAHSCSKVSSKNAFCRRYVVDSLRAMTPPAHSCSKVSSKKKSRKLVRVARSLTACV